MAEFPCLPLWTDAYLADTTHLSTLEHGAYFLLLMAMWRSKNQRLPDDDKFLAKIAKLTPRQWMNYRPVLADFFVVKDGWLSNGRLSDEWDAVRRHRGMQSNRAKARWLKTKDSGHAVAVPESCRIDATLLLPLTEEDTSKKELVSSPLTPVKFSGQELENFWTLYPHWPNRSSRKKTKEQFLNLIRKGIPHDTILNAAAEYAIAIRDGREKHGAVPAAERWLRDEKFSNDYTQSKPNDLDEKRPANKQPSRADVAMGGLALALAAASEAD